MEKAGEILKEVFKGDLSLKGERYASFFSSWKRILGKDLAGNVRLVDINKDTLLVQANHPGWMQMISFKKDKLLALINRLYPELGIKKLKVSMGSIPAKPKESAEADKGKSSVNKQASGEKIEVKAELQQVKNDDLKGMLERLYSSVLKRERK